MLCVNKMDLVDYSQDRFEEIKAEFRDAREALADLLVDPEWPVTVSVMVAPRPCLRLYVRRGLSGPLPLVLLLPR